jgi:hypothetical protein
MLANGLRRQNRKSGNQHDAGAKPAQDLPWVRKQASDRLDLHARVFIKIGVRSKGRTNTITMPGRLSRLHHGIEDSCIEIRSTIGAEFGIPVRRSGGNTCLRGNAACGNGTEEQQELIAFDR